MTAYKAPVQRYSSIYSLIEYAMYHGTWSISRALPKLYKHDFAYLYNHPEFYSNDRHERYDTIDPMLPPREIVSTPEEVLKAMVNMYSEEFYEYIEQAHPNFKDLPIDYILEVLYK